MQCKELCNVGRRWSFGLSNQYAAIDCLEAQPRNLNTVVWLRWKGENYKRVAQSFNQAQMVAHTQQCTCRYFPDLSFTEPEQLRFSPSRRAFFCGREGGVEQGQILK